MRELVFVLKDDNTFESYPRPKITAKEKYSDVIVLVSNKVLSTVVVANFILENGLATNLTQFLVPSDDKGKDVLNPAWEKFQTYAESNVWKASIHQSNLSAVSKFHRGQVGMSFNFYTSILTEDAVNYLGTFGTSDLPSSASDGDYYMCNVGNYTSVEADETFTYGQIAYWHDGGWVKGGTYTPIENTTTIFQAVDPSVVGIPPSAVDEDLVDVYDGLGNLQDQVDALDSDKLNKTELDDEVEGLLLDAGSKTNTELQNIITAEALRIDGTNKMEADIDLDGNQIKNVADAVADDNAINLGQLKAYVTVEDATW